MSEAEAKKGQRSMFRVVTQNLPIAIFLTLSMMLTIVIVSRLSQESQVVWAVFSLMVDHLFWLFMLVRVISYALIYRWLPSLVQRYYEGVSTEERQRSISQHRKSFVRIVVIYELLFPLDVIHWISGGGS